MAFAKTMEQGARSQDEKNKVRSFVDGLRPVIPGRLLRKNTCKRVLLAEPDLHIHLPAGGLSSGPSGSVFSVLLAFRDIRSFGPDLAWIMLDPR